MEQKTDSASIKQVPHNWPSKVRFLRSLDWELYPHLEEKYFEGSAETVYIKLGYDTTVHELCLLSEYDLPEGKSLKVLQ